MDVVSQAILDVALSNQAPTIALNIVHPKPSRWSTIVRSVADALHHTGVTREVVPLLPFHEWLGLLEQRSEGADADDMAEIVSIQNYLYYICEVADTFTQPAIKLLDFFRGMASADERVRQLGCNDMEVGLATLSTIKSQATSKAIAEVKPLGAGDAQLWVKYWASRGFFD